MTTRGLTDETLAANEARVGLGSPRAPSRWGWQAIIVALLTVIGSAIVLVPIEGVLPGESLDAAWAYAMASDAAHHLPFGRDVVFTFGPLSGLYTRLFFPDQRLTFTALKLVVTIAFCVGALSVCPRKRIAWALLLPLALANFLTADAFFLATPWLLVLIVVAPGVDCDKRSLSAIAFATALGPAALVKGTFFLTLVVSVGAAAIALWRESRLASVVLLCAPVVTTMIAWVAVGQYLPDLPLYLQRGFLVAGGYTDAMSLFGDPREIWLFLIAASMLLACQIFSKRAAATQVLSAAAILFITFKAGFVRHDQHAEIAGSTLLLLSLLFFMAEGRAAGIALTFSFAAWLTITADYRPVDVAALYDRTRQVVSDQMTAAQATLNDRGHFERAFRAAEARIASVEPAGDDRSADLYPYALSSVLASGHVYDPRPIPQSYSAYTPSLARLNADHIEKDDGPETVFFDIQPIDDHYPSLDDGPSWPVLLGRYRFHAFRYPYAVLSREETAKPAPIIQGFRPIRANFDDWVSVPPYLPLVWARLYLQPTFVGRIVSFAFKLPTVSIDVVTADGKQQTFRLIPGMADAGFLLSPLVTTARSFVALRSTADDVLAEQRVVQFRLRQDTGGLWGSAYAASLALLDPKLDPAVDDVALGHLDPGLPADGLPVYGECTIDRVGSRTAGPTPIKVSGPTAVVLGWGIAPTSVEGRQARNLRLALTTPDGVTRYASTEHQPRPDVDEYFHLQRPSQSGFVSRLNLKGLSGTATLRVVQDGPSGPAVCGQPVLVERDVRAMR